MREAPEAVNVGMENGWVVRHISWRGELQDGAHVTARKHWKDSWARRWCKGDYAVAYTKNPVGGGAPLALVTLTHTPYQDGVDNAWIIQFEVVEMIEKELDPVTGHHEFVGTQVSCETCGAERESGWHRRS